jgi:hypothetical protein
MAEHPYAQHLVASQDRIHIARQLSHRAPAVDMFVPSLTLKRFFFPSFLRLLRMTLFFASIFSIPERCGTNIVRGATFIYQEFLRRDFQCRTTLLAASSDQTAATRCRDI